MSERSFEQLMGALEAEIHRLERGDLSLEQSLAVFEEGIALTRACHERLDRVGQRLIEIAEPEPGGDIAQTPQLP